MQKITLTINIPDDKPCYITTIVADATPAGKDDSDRIRSLTREVWLVGVGETEARRVI